jgi:hypothetical protein
VTFEGANERPHKSDYWGRAQERTPDDSIGCQVDVGKVKHKYQARRRDIEDKTVRPNELFLRIP